MAEIELVVEGAKLGCTACVDSLLRQSGPELKVISQSTRRENGRLIATSMDIGEAIPPFSHCDELGVCKPVVTIEWIETKDDIMPHELIFGESMTYCAAGDGVIFATTSGQNPENVMSREEEIEKVFQYLKVMNELAKESEGWTVAALSDDVLRRNAADYVDVMRAMNVSKDENGFVSLWDLSHDVQLAVARLSGDYPDEEFGFNPSFVSNRIDAALQKSGKNFPMLDADAIMYLTIDSAVPNSALKNALIGGAIIGAITAPIWVPAVAGKVTTGAVALWERIKNFFNPISSIPYQEHHFMPKGESAWTWKFQQILSKYSLNVEMRFNIEKMQHQGRHCYKYYSWLLGEVQRIDMIAAGNPTIFSNLFEQVKRHVMANPDMLYNRGW